MRKLPTLLSTAALLLGLTSACYDCADDQPPTSSLQFQLLSHGGRNLIGRGPGQYSPDSVRVSLNGQAFDSHVVEQPSSGTGPVVSLAARQLFASTPGARLILHLGRTDTDTVDLGYTLRRSRCADFLDYHTVRFNSRPTGQLAQTGWYQFVKH